MNSLLLVPSVQARKRQSDNKESSRLAGIPFLSGTPRLRVFTLIEAVEEMDTGTNPTRGWDLQSWRRTRTITGPE